jgi:hypothetical protein
MSNITNVKVGIKGRAMPSGGEAGQILQKASDKDFDTIWTTPAGGASGNIPQPSVSLPLPDAAGGVIGTGIAFARQDHQHELNVSSDVTDIQMDGTASLGSKNTYARTDHIHQSDTYAAGFVPAGNIILTNSVHIFNSVNDLPTAGIVGRIAFVKVS